MRRVEYVWLDGGSTPKLRGKTRFLDTEEEGTPDWSFDGGSTEQGTLQDSDRVLKPIRLYDDPFSSNFLDNKIALCEVFDSNGEPHNSNSRSLLRQAIDDDVSDLKFWFGFEQEYTLMDAESEVPIAFSRKDPKPQGPYYCGVGFENIIARHIVDEHAFGCYIAGVALAGTNAEVMPGQWEYQTAPLDPLTAADNLWVSRYILQRMGEQRMLPISFDPKPKEGDWNGAGLHTNVSTELSRKASFKTDTTGLDLLKMMISQLKSSHNDSRSFYGEGNERRLTGEHETSDINKFTSGFGDRGVSVRIPTKVVNDGCGYLEDRRPSANADPYKVCSHIINSTRNTDES